MVLDTIESCVKAVFRRDFIFRFTILGLIGPFNFIRQAT
jgi:hypothetical protein